MIRRLVLAALLALALAPAAQAKTDFAAQAYNILTPGQFGGLPTTTNSTDQLALYDGLTPLRENVTAADVKRLYKSARFGGKGKVEKTPRKGLRLVRDSFGVPHITGKKRDDVMYGAGWVQAEDRGLFLAQGRGAARVSALDVPGVDAFSLVVSLRTFVPSKQANAFIAKQSKLLEAKGKEGKQVLADVDAYLDGINAYLKKSKSTEKKWTRTDVFAAFTFVGSIFGAGGGNEVRSSQFLAALRGQLGADQGTAVWKDLRSSDDPEAAVSATKTFKYGNAPVGSGAGTVVADPGSFVAAPGAGASAASAVPHRPASNWLLAAPKNSATGHSLFVGGPQLGYYYPEIVLEQDMHGGGIDTRGIAGPGIGPYVFIGRGKDFAWSLTSAGSDNQDFFLEQLCNTDGSAATRASTHYMYKGKCRAMTSFNAGLLKAGGGQPAQRLSFKETVHGPVHGTVTVGGKPYAMAKSRSTRGREALSMLSVKHMDENDVKKPSDFFRIANEWEYTFNWGYADNKNIAYFSSGRLPIRAKGVDMSLPTLGTGAFDWKGFLSQKGHPQALNPPSGVLTSWNNKPAHGFNSADDTWQYGSVHRVEMFKGLEKKNRLEDVVGVMNRAATTDLRAEEVWPAIREVLAGGPAPDATTQQAADLVSAWSDKFASRLDADNDGKVDDPGAAVMDKAWNRIADAVLSPVLGPSLDRFVGLEHRDNAPPGGFYDGWYGYVDKDLRTLLGKPVSGPLSRRYCGGGDLNACRDSLWAAVKAAADELAAAQGPDPALWRSDANAERMKFAPGLIPDTMRWVNRPTFQGVYEFGGHR